MPPSTPEKPSHPQKPSQKPAGKAKPGWDPFLTKIAGKARRKLKARRNPKRIWFGLGLFGMVGWAVAIPTLLGIALGVWIDRHVNSQYSWTLMLLAVGLGLGCFNAWYWISKESQRE